MGCVVRAFAWFVNCDCNLAWFKAWQQMGNSQKASQLSKGQPPNRVFTTGLGSHVKANMSI